MSELETGGVLQREGALSRTERLIFRTEENRDELVAIFDRRLAAWPVPFDAFFVNTRYGKTHVIASGARRSPPLVLTTRPVAAASCGPRSSPP
jgi:hypothetical protein